MSGQDLRAAGWRTSSYSGSDGQCVEVAFVGAGRVAVRDSKDRSGPVLVFTGAEWTAFLAAARTRRLDG